MALQQAIEALNKHIEGLSNVDEDPRIVEPLWALLEELNDAYSAMTPDEVIPEHLAGRQVVHLTVPADGPAAIRLFRSPGDAELFELIIHANSEYPSIDVIRKGRGDMYVRAMVNGDYVMDQEVPGNYSVYVVLAQD